VAKKNTSSVAPTVPSAVTTGDAHIPIVSSAHLARGSRPELSEFEYGLIIAEHAFNRWIVRCMTAAGMKDMNAMEVTVLHHVVHRDRAKKLADICFVLNVEDTHVVNYALKKLARIGLVESARDGKEAIYAATAAGKALCERYRTVREQCLTESLVKEGIGGASLTETAAFLRMLSGLYDQASRAATSL
jgi:predicted MarR family transcription regulator